MKKIVVLLSGFLFCGCTVLDVNPVSSSTGLTHVSIVKNPAVKVSDFSSVLKKGFEQHGISAEICSSPSEIQNSDCTVTYTALRAWDLVPYMTYGEIILKQNHKQIGYGEFRLRGDGGLALTKYRGTKSKMYPLMDKLLENYPQNTSGK